MRGALPTGLVAEDYEGLRYAMVSHLRLLGYQVIEAVDGLDALHKARNHPGSIEILVTDLMMPNVSGIELIERVRANAQMAHVPIIAMTAYSSGPADEARKAGADAVLKKPVSFEMMSSAINNALNPSAG